MVSEYLNPILQKLPHTADIALILGSGLGGFADSLEDKKVYSTSELPGYPQSTVQGHAGKIIFGRAGKNKVMCFQGRIHMYEGYPADTVTLPVQLAHKLGCKTLIVTNASGAMTKKFHPGDLLLVEDHINLQFRNPLIGGAKEGEPRWPDMCQVYSESLKQLAEQVAREQKISLQRGTLVAVLGPTYETPAETKMFARIGADAGCMSTIPEVTKANALGMKILGISCVTNFAAGLSDTPPNHEEVQTVANQVSEKFQQLLTEILVRMKDEG